MPMARMVFLLWRDLCKAGKVSRTLIDGVGGEFSFSLLALFGDGSLFLRTAVSVPSNSDMVCGYKMVKRIIAPTVMNRGAESCRRLYKARGRWKKGPPGIGALALCGELLYVGVT
jgi:hypothetical protein